MPVSQISSFNASNTMEEFNFTVTGQDSYKK